MDTSPFWPLFLTVFIGIFHLLGGAAIGQAVRVVVRGADAVPGGSASIMSLMLWGVVMGLLPLVFDWFFLIAPGHWVYGLVGPVLFFVGILAGALIALDLQGSAIITAAVGSAAFLMGLLSIPLMLSAAKDVNLGLADYIFAVIFVLLFVLVGGSLAWAGFSAIFRGGSHDKAHAAREQKRAARRKRSPDQGNVQSQK